MGTVPRESREYDEGDSLCRTSVAAVSLEPSVISGSTLRALTNTTKHTATAQQRGRLSPVPDDEMRDIYIDGIGNEGRWYRCVSAAGYTRDLDVSFIPLLRCCCSCRHRPNSLGPAQVGPRTPIVGKIRKDTVVEALEFATSAVPDSKRRMRCQRGWVSLVSQDGTKLFEQCAAPVADRGGNKNGRSASALIGCCARGQRQQQLPADDGGGGKRLVGRPARGKAKLPARPATITSSGKGGNDTADGGVGRQFVKLEESA